MPKIIKNLDERILTEAKKQLFLKGYSAMTMRGVADACDIAVGTLYNYYDSKNVLITRIMVNDWIVVLDEIKKKCAEAQDIFEGFRIIYDYLSEFMAKYRFVWLHFGKDFSIRRDMPDQYNIFIGELSAVLDEILIRCYDDREEFISLFLAEILVSATTKWEFEYAQLENILKRLFREEKFHK